MLHTTAPILAPAPAAAADADARASLAALAHALGSGPLMIEPGYLESLLARCDSPVGSRPQRADDRGYDGADHLSWFHGRWDPQSRINVTDDGIGLVRVAGMLVARGPWLGSIWGMTSYEGLAEQLKRIGNDPAVRQVVLDIDSGGGMAAGLWDLMPAIDALKAKKPVHAIANPFCASAAYAIGCAADTLHVARGANVGSIGVVRTHTDMSAMLERWGLKTTYITAGRLKAAGNSAEPLSPEVRAMFQSGVDKLYGEFVDHVARYRGIDAGAVRATEARVYAADDAVDLGLADGVMSLDELVDHLRTSKPAARSRAPKPTGAPSMTTTPGASLSQGDLTALSASIAAALQPAQPARLSADANDTVTRADADRMAADAAAAAVKADRDRMSAVLALPEAKDNMAYAIKLALKGMGADEAKDLLADLPKADAKPAGFGHALAQAMAQSGTSAGVKPEGKVDGSPTAGMKPLGETMAERFAPHCLRRRR